MGGDNRTQNLIPLCLECHGVLHNKKYNEEWKALQKAGIERAKAQGKFKGGTLKKINRNDYYEAKGLYLKREITKKDFAELLNVSRPKLDAVLKDKEKHLT